MFLSHEEIADLTGYKCCRLQIKWLTNHGYKFEINRIGKPKVLKTYLEARLGSQIKNFSRTYEPNFSNQKMFG